MVALFLGISPDAITAAPGAVSNEVCPSSHCFAHFHTGLLLSMLWCLCLRCHTNGAEQEDILADAGRSRERRLPEREQCVKTQTYSVHGAWFRLMQVARQARIGEYYVDALIKLVADNKDGAAVQKLVVESNGALFHGDSRLPQFNGSKFFDKASFEGAHSPTFNQPCGF